MDAGPFQFTAELFEWEGPAAWHFVAMPEDLADLIAELRPREGPGFGSVPVRVGIGEVEWTTSVFPDRGRRTYLLPVKALVRRRLDIADGDLVEVTLSLR